jgi:hypothetical protein
MGLASAFGLSRWWSDDDLAELPGPAEMRRLLRRECARAWRTCSTLCVLVYECREGEAAETLALALRRRLRETDEVGWMDEGRLCAVLPDTPAAGALRAAEDVARSLPIDSPPPACAVYSFPEQSVTDLFGSPCEATR